MAAVRLCGPRLLARTTATRLLPALTVLASVGMAVALATGTLWGAIAGFACLGAGTALVIPSLFTATGRIAGLAAGGGIAGVSALGWIGYMAGPPLIGQLAALGGLRAALVLLPILTLAIAIGSTRIALNSV
jgi:hypothetical protein